MNLAGILFGSTPVGESVTGSVSNQVPESGGKSQTEREPAHFRGVSCARSRPGPSRPVLAFPKPSRTDLTQRNSKTENSNNRVLPLEPRSRARGKSRLETH